MLIAVFVLSVVNVILGVVAIWQRQQTIDAMKERAR